MFNFKNLKTMKTKKLNSEQMENLEGGGLSPKAKCGIALGLYAVSFIAVAAATGGLAILFALAGFGGSIWGAISACDGVLHNAQPVEYLKPFKKVNGVL